MRFSWPAFVPSPLLASAIFVAILSVFHVRWAADPMIALFPFAGMTTAGLYLVAGKALDRPAGADGAIV
jgi:hypothetical protein